MELEEGFDSIGSALAGAIAVSDIATAATTPRSEYLITMHFYLIVAMRIGDISGNVFINREE